MEATIIAALVAGAVSLVGLLVNLHIAKRSREAVQIQVAAAAKVATAQEAVKYLRKFTVDIEKLRAEGWLFRMALDQELLGSIIAESPDKLWERANAFEEEFLKFFRNWAEVKTEVPKTQIDTIRLIRHDCKNTAQDVVEKIVDVKTKYYNKLIPEDERKSIKDLLSSLLSKLDVLFNRVNNIKNDKLTDFIVPELATPELEHIVEANQKLYAERLAKKNIPNQANSADAKSRAAD